MLGWEPRVPLEIGLERTIAYFDRLLAEAGENRTAVLHCARAEGATRLRLRAAATAVA